MAGEEGEAGEMSSYIPKDHVDGAAMNADGTPVLLVDSNAKYRSFKIRAKSGALMIAGFLLVLLMGPPGVIVLLLFLQFLIFKELFGLHYVAHREKNIRGNRIINWYLFFLTVYTGYGQFLMGPLREILPEANFRLFRYHSLISFLLTSLGMVMFVLTLKKGQYKYQFTQFAWVCLTLLFVVGQFAQVTRLAFEGMIWFLIPASLVIVNDIFAYIFGFFFGRTPLIKLSPKKTWEGFIGGLFSTLIASVVLSAFLSRYDFWICPRTEFGVLFPSCETPESFVWRPLSQLLPFWMPASLKEINYMPIQGHAMVFALFSSLIAPFAGFFASGLKRAWNIKDFGDTIPGHGGVTDRFDCQIIMSGFSSLYVATFVRFASSVFEEFLQMDEVEQLAIYQQIRDHLLASGQINA